MTRAPAILMALASCGAPIPVVAQGLFVPATPVDVSAMATKAEMQAAISATAATALRAPLCSIVTIPAGNTVVNTSAETAFATTCRIPAGTIAAGSSLRLDLRFQLGVNAIIPTLRGRVYLARTAAPVLSTCVAAAQCLVVLDTGAVGGLTAGSALYGNADIAMTFPTTTSIEASGQLNFQTGATAVIAISAQSATSAASPALTIPWDTTTVDTYVVETAQWSAASASNYIQKRQDTPK